MNILEIMKNRHSVRQYKDKDIEETKRNEIISFIDVVNSESNLDIQIFFR